MADDHARFWQNERFGPDGWLLVGSFGAARDWARRNRVPRDQYIAAMTIEQFAAAGPLTRRIVKLHDFNTLRDRREISALIAEIAWTRRASHATPPPAEETTP